MCSELVILCRSTTNRLERAADLFTNVAVTFVTKSGYLDKLVSMMPGFGHIVTL